MSRRPDDRSPELALVPGVSRHITDADRARVARQYRLGEPGDQLWLHWRADRRQYCTASYDPAGRSSRFVSTGVGPGPGEHPPLAAFEALAARFAERQAHAVDQSPADVGLSTILMRYLADHAAHVAAPERASYAVIAIERFIAHQAARGDSIVTVDRIGRQFVADYGQFRLADGISYATIERELATLRAATSWAAASNMPLISSKPQVPRLQVDPRLVKQVPRVAYSLPQLAAILEAAAAVPERHHLQLFIVTMLATHGRTEAILECNLDLQYQDDVIDWLGPDRGQTSKRRAMVPVAPVLASWLAGRSGKLIRYRSIKAARRWADPRAPEYLERETFDISDGFKACILAAAAAHPGLRLRRPVLDASGHQVVRLVKRRERGRWLAGEELPQWQAIGYPNAVRHTIHTQLRRIGVADAQIDAASGHVQQGTGRHYNQFDARRDLADFVAGVEQLFAELRAFTTAHLRTPTAPNIVDMAPFRAGKDRL